MLLPILQRSDCLSPKISYTNIESGTDDFDRQLYLLGNNSFCQFEKFITRATSLC